MSPVRSLAALALLSALAAPAPAAAQASPLVVEVRGGASVPAFSFADGTRPGEGVSAGPSVSVDIAVSGDSRRTFIAGFSQHRFGCDELGCPEDESYVATGVNLGWRWNLTTSGDVIPWVRLAGRTVRVELPERDAGAEAVSDLGFGGEVGAGVYIGTFSRLALNPGVRLAATNSGLPGGGVLRLRYWVADLGLALAF